MNKFKAPFIINDSIQSYLTSELFSNYKKIFFESKTYIPNRVDLLVSMLKDKVVLHFGCCDHEGLIEEKIRDKTHLQVKISNIAAKCIGIDIDHAALAKLKNLNVNNCKYYDACYKLIYAGVGPFCHVYS